LHPYGAFRVLEIMMKRKDLLKEEANSERFNLNGDVTLVLKQSLQTDNFFFSWLFQI